MPSNLNSCSSFHLLLFILAVINLSACIPTTPEENAQDNQNDRQLTNEGCAEVPEIFVESIWPTMESSCVNCHSGDGIAATTKLVFTNASASDDALIENYNVLRNFSLTNANTVLEKTIGLPSHAGGAPYIDATSDAYQDLQNLIAQMPQQNCSDSNSNPEPEPQPEPANSCSVATAFFNDEVWPSMQQSCTTCHTASGIARETGLIFNLSNSSFDNYNVVRSFALTNAETLLGKTIDTPAHGGGAPYVDETSLEYMNLENLLSLITQCGTELQPEPDSQPELEPTPASYFDDIQFYDEQETLRKAATLLAARLPTTEEISAVAEGGEPSLRAAIRNMMQGEHFENFLLETANNHFLSTGITLTPTINPSDKDYPNLQGLDIATRNSFDLAFKQEPLQLIRYIVTHERPYTEVLTADYTVVNPILASIYEADVPGGFDDEADQTAWKKATIPNMLRFGRSYPHAGVLTVHAWRQRFATTPTNRNRHRAKMVLRQFLGIDIEKSLGQRPLNDETKDQFLVPTMEDPACTSCHNIIDPIAGAFQNWADNNQYRRYTDADTSLSQDYRSDKYPKNANGKAYFQQGDNWYRDMLPPGFNGTPMTGGYDGNETALQWLGREMIKDNRFAIGTIHFWYHGLFGEAALFAPIDAKASDFQARLNAFTAQDAIFQKIAARFREDQGHGAHNLKDLLVDLIVSKWFRAESILAPAPEREIELESLGSYHLLTPEQLSRKMEATLGMTWSKMQLTREYGFLYGGFDGGKKMSERNISLNTLLSVVIERMGYEMGCNIVTNDFSNNVDQRILFPFVELNDTPNNAEESIKRNIQHLHNLMLAESLALDDSELLRTYELFNAVWDERDTPAETNIACSLSNSNDPKYIGRTWSIVLQYLMSDPKYIYSY